MTALAAGRHPVRDALGRLALGGTLALIGGAGGLAACALVLAGRGSAAAGLGLVALFVVIWKRPVVAPVLLVGLALTVEQFPYMVGTRNGAFTDHIPFFQGVGGSIHANPADLTLLVLVSMWVLRRRTAAVAEIRRSPLRSSVLAVTVAVLLGLMVGQLHHGTLRIALTEVRPYVYLAGTFMLAAAFMRTRRSLTAALWALVLGSGFKAIQGLLLFLAARNDRPRPDAILGHEEAYFFGLFVLLTFALWLFGLPGKLRATATLLLPIVLAADLANHRRTAWLVIAGGVAVIVAAAYASAPRKRRAITRAVAVFGVVLAVYLPVYWNHTGALAGPAAAIHSAIAPNTRDASSDLYRVQENANLKLNIKLGGLVGRGFGVPIVYALPIVDISDIDPLIAYIPHNGVYYVLMRLGLLGGIAFWSLLGAGIIVGARLVRSADREIAVFGALLAAGLVGYALVGALDQGFFFYRIAFVVGTLLGLGEAVRRLEAESVPT